MQLPAPRSAGPVVFHAQGNLLLHLPHASICTVYIDVYVNIYDDFRDVCTYFLLFVGRVPFLVDCSEFSAPRPPSGGRMSATKLRKGSLLRMSRLFTPAKARERPKQSG